MKPVLGTTPDGAELRIDVDRLIETRLVLTAISGGGKSHAIRRILEQTHGKVQQIVIDPEGEFYSLREKFQYIIAGKPNGVDGDCPAEVRSANLLALKLLELRVSAIVDIYSLSADPNDVNGRIPFVKAFLQALLSAPKNLYHPCLVVLDEAHIFAPEKGEGEASSRGSVIRLMSEGRKKLLCGILATQRLSKLDKSAISEAHNMMIGKSTLDVDVDRARKYLGFRKGNELAIRRMPRGHFWSFGPAICEDVTDILVAETITSTPKIGSRATAPAPPSQAIQDILGKLADLPEEAARKEQTEKDLRGEIATLKKQLRERMEPAATSSAAPEVKADKLTAAYERGAKAERKRIRKEIFAALSAARKELKRTLPFAVEITIADQLISEAVGTEAIESIDKAIAALDKALPVEVEAAPAPAPIIPRIQPQSVAQTRRPIPAAAPRPAAASTNGSQVSKAGRKLLTALAQFGQCEDIKLGALTGYSAGAGHFSNELSKLRSNAFIEGERSALRITGTGLDALGHYDPLPTGKELLDYWKAKLPKGPAAILGALASVYPDSVTDGELGAAIGYSPSAGHFSNCLSELRTRDLITGNRNNLKASEHLFS